LARPVVHPLRQALIAFAISTAVTAALFQLARAVPFVHSNLQALVAAVFLYIPVAVTWRTGEDLAAFGFTHRPLRRSLIFGVAAPLIVFPLFVVGYVVFYQLACDLVANRAMCARFLGWDGLGHVRGPVAPLQAVFTHLIVVALPEELFFRGFLLKRLETALPPKRRVLGGGIGWALVLSAVLFALGHVLVDLNPRRLAVFFPGLLFGWMRSATGSILAGTLVHAGSNLFIESLQRTFFR
jgi:uncharacterized protein